MANKKIVDVSTYNGKVDWKKAKGYGVDGAIIKIIRKDLNRDNCFDQNYKGCNENKIPWGVYQYTYASTPAKAKSDMKLVCDILDKIDKSYFKYGVWFDIEDNTQARLSKSAVASIINAAQEVVESRGYKFGVYTGKDYLNEHININQVHCKNWWLARYYKGFEKMAFKTDPNSKYKPNNAGDIMAWQYTSTGVFPSKISTGNSGNFDLSIVYKTFTDPETAPNKKSTEDIAREVIAGKWGNGEVRKQRLKAAGYDYNTIQAAVNKLLK